MHDIAGFTKQDFEGAANPALLKLHQILSQDAQKVLIEPLADYLCNLFHQQRKAPLEPVFCVSISFLNTQLQCGRPACRVDAYGDDWMLYDRPLYTETIDCGWFLPLWQGLVNHFQSLLDQRTVQKHCTPLQAEQAARSCMGPLLSMMGSLLKYQVESIPKLEAYQKLRKGELFRLEFGEYYDWKTVLLGQYKDEDIFNSMGHEYPHRRFTDKIYENKSFNNYNLKGCRFEGCRFSDCKFPHTVLNDCIFRDCEFKHVTFINCLMAGVQISDSTLSNTEFENVIGAFEGIPWEKVDDWYRPMQMQHTSMDHVSFKGCYLSHCSLTYCTTTFVTVLDSRIEQSGFSALAETSLEV